jgi:hypothetical protein
MEMVEWFLAGFFSGIASLVIFFLICIHYEGF